MKFLDAIATLSCGAKCINKLESINDTIQDRLFWLEMREPESEGSVYDTWEEKFDEFTEIAELSQEILENIENEKFNMKENIEELQSLVDNFQIMYGGLSRLKIKD